MNSNSKRYLLCAFFLFLFSGCETSGQLFHSEGDAGQGGSGASGAETGGASSMGGEAGSLGGGPSLVPGPTAERWSIAGGDRHGCAVADGALYCFGSNEDGALGLGDVQGRFTATRVGTESDWEVVGAGNGFSCGLRSEQVWCWGSGSLGQLGNGAFLSSLVPVPVSLPGAALSLSVGHQTVCAILEEGSLWCWGANAEGQLAQSEPFPGSGPNSAVPLRVEAASDYLSVSVGQGHACAIRTPGDLYCWGRNSDSQLGLGVGASGQIRSTQRVTGESDFTQVAAGQGHTCALRSGGGVWCWGENSYGQIGVDGNAPRLSPAQVEGLSGVAQIALDTFHTCALTTQGELSCFGRNVEGMLANGTRTPSFSPLPTLPSDGFRLLAVGRFHTCAVRGEALFCAGQNLDGRLGVGDGEQRDSFEQTHLLP